MQIILIYEVSRSPMDDNSHENFSFVYTANTILRFI